MRLQVPRKGQQWTALHYHARIALDGRLVPLCVMADEERGRVAYYAQPLRLDPNGRPVVLYAEGRVRIIDSREVDVHYAYTRCDRG